MRNYYFKGNIQIQSPLHIGSGESGDFIDNLIMRDSNDNPYIPGTSICGIMAIIAKKRLMLDDIAFEKAEFNPIFRSLFGSAGKKGEGEESRLIVLDAILVPDKNVKIFIQDRNSIDRERGSSLEKYLFHDEVVSSNACFEFSCEFREKVEFENLNLLIDVLEIMGSGLASIGGKTGTGHGNFKLTILECFYFERTNPDDILNFALEKTNALPRVEKITSLKKHNISLNKNISKIKFTPEVIKIKGIIRPLDPILVKTGFPTDIVNRKNTITINELKDLPIDDKPVSVDSAFCCYPDNIPYIPGSSIRGCFRSHAEKIIRTLIYNINKNDQNAKNSVWDVKTLGIKAKELKDKDYNEIYDEACIISKLFGFGAMGGRISFSDAEPENKEKFKGHLKLIDHVAIDRFTGGAAQKKKFNSRPFFPNYPEQDSSGDMKFLIRLEDFEEWHLGLVALLLKDLYNGQILIGYGKNKGFGRVKLLKGNITIEGLTYNFNKDNKGIFADFTDKTGGDIGEFIHIPETPIKSGENFWVNKDDRLFIIIEKAIRAFKKELQAYIGKNKT
ncbi:hypothetical protein HY745_06110 [Candidatus Desantisbacteria bacterium]|nr:hypothetical protein [Candidatus Desantisbacteria bacterium]